MMHHHNSYRLPDSIGKVETDLNKKKSDKGCTVSSSNHIELLFLALSHDYRGATPRSKDDI